MPLLSSIHGVNATDSTALRQSTTGACQKLQEKCEAGISPPGRCDAAPRLAAREAGERS
jgi:hypothetical protein